MAALLMPTADSAPNPPQALCLKAVRQWLAAEVSHPFFSKFDAPTEHCVRWDPISVIPVDGHRGVQVDRKVGVPEQDAAGCALLSPRSPPRLSRIG